MKNKIFYKHLVFTCFFLFLFLELFSYVYFRFNDVKNLEYYKEKRKSSLGYFFNKNLDLVLPKVDNLKVHYTKEFVDRFLAKDVLGLGFGLFDEGIDITGKYKIVAIGDSFTVGIGSLDPINNNIYTLIEKKNKNFEIINLGGLAINIHEQKYLYEKIKNKISHKYVIYNFFSGGDYIENIDDYIPSLHIKNLSKNLNEKETQKIINDFNIVHGYKYYLEYLMNNSFRLYSIYFFLKIYDLFIIKLELFGWKNNPFAYSNIHNKKYPKDIGKLWVVNKDLYNENLRYKSEYICQKKYCFIHNKIFEIDEYKNKITRNSINLINNFNKELQNNKINLIVVIHPSARNFYQKNTTKIDYNFLDNKLIFGLDKNIKVIDLRQHLLDYQKNNPNIDIFWKYDGHYKPEGYLISSDYIYKELIKIF